MPRSRRSPDETVKLPIVDYAFTKRRASSAKSTDLIQNRVTPPAAENQASAIRPEHFRIERPVPYRESAFADEAARATELIKSASKVGIFTDYDADGMMASASIQTAFRELDIPYEAYIPSREEGYGLSEAGLRQLHKRGCDVLLTADLGASNADQVQLAKQLGMKTIITDHHLFSESPDSDVFIDPINTEYRSLSGCAVVSLLLEELNPDLHPLLLPYMAISSISDAMPMISESRYFVKKFFEAPTYPGIIGSAAHQLYMNRLTLGTIGYYLVPKINAISRVGRVEDFSRIWDECSVDTSSLLNNYNKKRKDLQKAAMLEVLADTRAEDDLLVTQAGRSGAILVGLLGLLSGRLTNTFGKPSLVGSLRNGKFKGSGRAPEGIHLKHFLDFCCPKLPNKLKVGGHAAAFGFEYHGTAEELRVCLNELFRKYAEDFRMPVADAYDFEVSFSDLQFLQLEEAFLELFPFGSKFAHIAVKIDDDFRKLKFKKEGFGWYTYAIPGIKLNISEDALFLAETGRIRTATARMTDLLPGNLVYLEIA